MILPWMALAATAAVVGIVAAPSPSRAGPSRGGPPPARPALEVDIHDNFFDPRTVTIAAGDRVHWVWKGQNRHNVVFHRIRAGAPTRRIKTHATGQASRTFASAGVYRYACTLYDGMEGTLIVDPAH